jgi:hypothetical protein
MKLLSLALKASKPVLDKIDDLIWKRRQRMLLMDYDSKDEQPLRDMLDAFFTRHGFQRQAWGASGRRDSAQWHKRLGPTIKAVISITLHPAVAPNRWSLEPTVMVFSGYVARLDQILQGAPDRNPSILPGQDAQYVQVLNFQPARLRWHDDRHLESPSLKGRLETIGSLTSELADVFDRYVGPVLDECRAPLALARFLVRAETGACATRAGWDEPRFKRIDSPVAAALLFDEAGESSAALACLEAGRAHLAQLWENEEPAWTAPRYARIDRVLDYLRTRAPQVKMDK